MLNGEVLAIYALVLESPSSYKISVNHYRNAHFFPNATMEIIRCSVSPKNERLPEDG